MGQLCSIISTTFRPAWPSFAMYPPSSRIFTSSATLSFKLPSGTRFRFASSTSWARCFRRRSTASRPIFSSMNRRAQSVMCVYASGKMPVDPRLRAKKARGRPRPAARDDRSTRPFPSSTARCFSVAILEMPMDAARSVRETAPCRFKVSRICFLEDEKPASRPPSSTSGSEAMECPSNRVIIYLCVYKIGASGPASAGRDARTAARLGLRRRGRHRLLSLSAPRQQEDDQQDGGHDRDRGHDGGGEEARPRRGWELEIGLNVRRDRRIVDDRGPALEAEAREERESDERVAVLADAREADAGDDLAIDDGRRAVDYRVADPDQSGDARRITAKVHGRAGQASDDEVGHAREVDDVIPAALGVDGDAPLRDGRVGDLLERGVQVEREADDGRRQGRAPGVIRDVGIGEVSRGEVEGPGTIGRVA